jgi:hypothetical protein
MTPEWEGPTQRKPARHNPTKGHRNMANANPNTVTFSPEQLQAVIAQAIAEHEKNRQAQTKTDVTDQMNVLTVRAFRKAGYNEADVKPRENILTYSKWVEKGFKVKQGERSVAVKSLRLFHERQVEPISKKEQEEISRQARGEEIGQVSSVSCSYSACSYSRFCEAEQASAQV